MQQLLQNLLVLQLSEGSLLELLARDMQGPEWRGGSVVSNGASVLPTSNGNKKWDKVAKVSQSGKQISYEASKKNYNIVKNKSKFDFKV